MNKSASQCDRALTVWKPLGIEESAGAQDAERILSKLFAREIRRLHDAAAGAAQQQGPLARTGRGVRDPGALPARRPRPYRLTAADEEELAELAAARQAGEPERQAQAQEAGADAGAAAAGATPPEDAVLGLRVQLAPAQWRAVAALAGRLGLDPRKQPPCFNVELPARTTVALLRRLLARRLGVYPSFLELSTQAPAPAPQPGAEGQQQEYTEYDNRDGRRRGRRQQQQKPDRPDRPQRQRLLLVELRDVEAAAHNRDVLVRQTLAACGLAAAGSEVLLAFKPGDVQEVELHADEADEATDGPPERPAALTALAAAAAAAATNGPEPGPEAGDGKRSNRRKRRAAAMGPAEAAAPRKPRTAAAAAAAAAAVDRPGPAEPSWEAVEAAVVDILAGRSTGADADAMLTCAHATALLVRGRGLLPCEALGRRVRLCLDLHSYPAPPAQGRQGQQAPAPSAPQLQQKLTGAKSQLTATELCLLVDALRTHGADWAAIAKCPCFHRRRSKKDLFCMWAHVVSLLYVSSTDRGGAGSGSAGAWQQQRHQVAAALAGDVELVRRAINTWEGLKGLEESPLGQ